ncbi:sirohydrochlorin chelatase [Planctomycetaceae bacterium SH139]
MFANPDLLNDLLDIDGGNLTAPERRGILLVGHGTRDAAGTSQFFELADRLRQHLDSSGLSVPVQPSLLEFQSPTIAEGWRNLVQQGVRHIEVSPLLLFAAGHAREDIPAEIAKCAVTDPHVTWSLARPLSRHREIVELVCERITQALAVRMRDIGGQQSPGDWTLLMVGRGSRDPCASADMRLLSEVVGYRLGKSRPHTAFYAMAEPRLPAVLEQLAGQTCRQLIVYPHLLFAGRLYQAICDQVAEFAVKNPQVGVTVANYLGPQRQVAAAIWERASAGHVA